MHLSWSPPRFLFLSVPSSFSPPWNQKMIRSSSQVVTETIVPPDCGHFSWHPGWAGPDCAIRQGQPAGALGWYKKPALTTSLCSRLICCMVGSLNLVGTLFCLVPYPHKNIESLSRVLELCLMWSIFHLHPCFPTPCSKTLRTFSL